MGTPPESLAAGGQHYLSDDQRGRRRAGDPVSPAAHVEGELGVRGVVR
ncbi:hypothetical protein [Amycolatopsis sp.]|nr:hypothetical protein [Amycolatopsis sp.]